MKTARVFNALITLLGVALWTPVGATNWTMTNSVGLGVTGGSIYCSTTTCQTTSSGLTGSVITMSAYSTPNTGTPTPDNGNWLDARIAIYGGGVGISNNRQSGETSFPQHAIDNRIVNDILVVDFGSNNWDVSSFGLGWTCNMSNYYAGFGCGGSVNVAAWVGGDAEIDFNTTAFSGSGSSATLPGFQALTLSNDPGGTGTKADTTSYVGRYLVIAGDLGSYSSAFKVNGISAVEMAPPPPPPDTVPVPGTLPLIFLGLLLLSFVSRRRLAAAR